MRRIISAGIGLLALAVATQPAAAADLAAKAPVNKAPPPVATWTWDGWYVGANVGYSWAHWGSTSLLPNFPAVAGDVTAPTPFAGLALFTNTADPRMNGAIGGLHAGRNWQVQSWVFGLESDFSLSGERRNLDGSVSVPLNPFNTITLAATNQWKLSSIGTGRGRLGWASDTWLVYVTGGLAFGRAQYGHTATTLITPLGAPTIVANSSVAVEAKTKWGYAIGGGIEKAFTPNLIGRLEYLYIDLGSYTFVQNTFADTSVRLHDNVVRVGISYLFNPVLVVANY